MDWLDKALDKEFDASSASGPLGEMVCPLLPMAVKAVQAFLQAGGLRKTAAVNPAAGLRMAVEDALSSCPRIEVSGAVPVEDGLGVLVADTETGEAGLLRFASNGEVAFEAVPELPTDAWADAIAAMEERFASAPVPGLVKLAEAGIPRKIIRERCYNAGYVIRDEVWTDPEGHEMVMERVEIGRAHV